MSWVYGYQAGPPGGPFVDLLDYCDHVRVVTEGDAPKRGSNPDIPYVDGEYSDPDKYRTGGLISLDCMISYTNPAGLVTHVDGAAGHVFENLQSLKSLIGGVGGAGVVLRRDTPHIGLVQTPVEFLGGLRSAGPRMRYVFQLRKLIGAWEEQALSTNNELAVSTFPHAFTIDTGGDYEIGDLKITLTCKSATGSNVSLEEDGDSQIINMPGSFVLNDEIVVDLGSPRTLTLNGSRYAPITANRGGWIRLPPNVTSLPMTLDASTGTWDLEMEWRNKWL